MTPPEDDQVRARQRSRSIVTALILGALAILLFFLTIAKIGTGHL